MRGKFTLGSWQLALSHAFIACLLLLSACVKQKPTIIDPDKPKRPKQEYFDKKYLLYRLGDGVYNDAPQQGSFYETQNKVLVEFKPLGYDSKLNLQYTHIYSDKCVYHVNDETWKFAEVCFPNTCLTNDEAYAEATIRNTTKQTKTFYARLFYQNTTYWYATDSSIDFNNANYLDNYYGASKIMAIEVAPESAAQLKIPYSIGMNPKHEYDYDPSKDPARAGNYEFMLMAKETKDDLLLSDSLDLKTTNPFAEVKRDELKNGGKKYFNYTGYVGSHHFKFVALDEYFDGVNDLKDNHLYYIKHGGEKRLCDTCTGWYKAVINENWNNTEFFEGYIRKAGYVKADYGVRKENCKIDSNGITITIPKSRRGDYKKTWGEFLFGPSFKYGHLTVRAKFSRMMNKPATSNGIIHNLWLYQSGRDEVDTTNPFHDLVNDEGKQPYEIDFEFWSTSANDTLTLWDDQSFINYSIVDYMRDANVQLKPGEIKQFGNYKAERVNKRQAGIEGEEYNRDFFDHFHTYELYWKPDGVRFMLDGQEKALITKDMAKIPDKYMFLWIGSPMYQDGTYYLQSFIPFLKHDKQSIIDYIRIE